jgi:hypothetical protein
MSLDEPHRSSQPPRPNRKTSWRFQLPAALLALMVLSGSAALLAVALQQAPDRLSRFRQMSERTDARIAAEPFVGVTTDGTVETGLYEIRSTGVSTAPVRQATEAYLASLTPEQRAASTFEIDDDEWRKWMNQHFYVRQGTSFLDMTEAQREAAFALLGSALSARGLKLSRDIMRLNHTLGELAGNNFEEFGEWLYHLTVMGEPSATEPWGWQLDGHHLILNYFVLGDQVVMSPVFVGSEPVMAESGKFKGTAILQEEQAAGLAMIRSLGDGAQMRAVISADKTGNDNQGEALQDNLQIPYAGLPAKDMKPQQRKQLLELIELFVGNQREDHAAVRMDEVEHHLDRTYFAWIGGIEDDAVFYYRIHSPVILIEFDHQRPANLRHIMPPEPNRQHIHAVVRTPNGNDYGKDLLRQHLAQHPH